MLNNNLEYTVGFNTEEWGRGTAQYIDFIVTEDCNLRCKYCYISHKNSKKNMKFETAKKFIDYFLSDKIIKAPNVILGFIGGEPFLEIDLINKIVDYFKIQTYLKNLEWYWNYRISICTNGINYDNSKVQEFIKKNKNKLSITITVDGTKEKHDLQRVFLNGEGSYDIIEKNIPLWLTQFPGDTKVTFAHDDLKLLRDSIIHLWKLGISSVNANVVFEDVWEKNDDKIFEQQLIELADYIIDNNLYDKYQCSFFSDFIGEPYRKEDLVKTTCGAGKMIAVGPSGNLYPCLRYKDYSLNNKKEIVIGDVDTGIDMEKVRAFRLATFKFQCDKECIKCEVATGCSYCQGHSYDCADTETNFQRAKYICKMHKARVRANNYFFNRLYNEKNIERVTYRNEYKKMYFILSDQYIPFCENYNNIYSKNKMSKETIKKGLLYCKENFFTPVFLHSKDKIIDETLDIYNGYRIQHIISAKFYQEIANKKNYILVFDKDSIHIECENQESIILNVDWNDIYYLYDYIVELFSKTERINLNLLNINKKVDWKLYKNQLNKIKDFLVDEWTENGNFKEFNKITDIFFVDSQDTCGAGENSMALSPSGEFYVCPLRYSTGQKSIGDLIEGMNNKNKHLYSLEYAPLCSECPATHCIRCNYINKLFTNEVNIPPSFKCKASFIEKEISSNFKQLMKNKKINLRELTKTDYIDPMTLYMKNSKQIIGYQIAD